MDDESKAMIFGCAEQFMKAIGEAVMDVMMEECIKVEQSEEAGRLWLQAFVSAAKNNDSGDDFKTKFEDKLSYHFFTKPGTDPLDGILYTSAKLDDVAKFGHVLWQGVNLGHNLTTDDDASEAETFAWQNKFLDDMSSAAEEVATAVGLGGWCCFNVDNDWPAVFKAKQA
jgi:hypothetical protein